MAKRRIAHVFHRGQEKWEIGEFYVTNIYQVKFLKFIKFVKLIKSVGRKFEVSSTSLLVLNSSLASYFYFCKYTAIE